MLTVYALSNGQPVVTDHVDPAWLDADSGVVFWADLVGPARDDVSLLKGTFGFHELAVEDALSETH